MRSVLHSHTSVKAGAVSRSARVYVVRKGQGAGQGVVVWCGWVQCRVALAVLVCVFENSGEGIKQKALAPLLVLLATSWTCPDAN